MSGDDLPDYAPLDSLPGSAGDVTRADVVRRAKAWLGRELTGGSDLVLEVARELGLAGASLRELAAPIPLSMVRPGHLLAYSGTQGRYVGIVCDYMVGGLSLVQSTDSGAVVEWELGSPRKGWRPLQAYALRGVV